MDDREEIIELLRVLNTELFSIEAVTEALISLKDNPKLTVKQALEIGIKEWDK
ncbi:MAG: hypothetical protein WDA09_00930 [Bacteriovoracaceae bacterium]